ncbi:hypothetical protein B0T24DRAFT_622896 [Lasiosphaeria ovina]|uniref:Pentatricopeptide repeat-containing protein n=1 Tax=Lasiosphaeria ovina TaxID=92902 RepID=A0AAE0KAZ2_9PEZI|nr:hypothetical protein B0T24DRAFT_622896 [Lasiosphaeria ovina]
MQRSAFVCRSCLARAGLRVRLYAQNENHHRNGQRLRQSSTLTLPLAPDIGRDRQLALASVPAPEPASASARQTTPQTNLASAIPRHDDRENKVLEVLQDEASQWIDGPGGSRHRVDPAIRWKARHQHAREIFELDRSLMFQMLARKTWSRTQAQDAALFRDWRDGFEAAYWRLYTQGNTSLGMEPWKPPEFPTKLERTPAFGLWRRWADSKMSVIEMREEWEARPRIVYRSVEWCNVVALTLRYTPHIACEVFEAIWADSAAPQYALRDAVTFLCHSLELLPPDARPERAAAVTRLIVQMLSQRSARRIRFKDEAISCLIGLLDQPKTVAELYSALESNYHPLKFFTRLRFANRLAPIVAHKQMVLDMLGDLVADAKKKGVSFFETHVGGALATSLLSFGRADPNDPAQVVLRVGVYQALIEAGLRPNLANFTAIIRGFGINKDSRTAMKVFKLALEQGIEPDKFLYSTIFHAIKLGGNPWLMARIIGMVSEGGIRGGSLIFWNDVLHAIYLSAWREVKFLRSPRRDVRSFEVMLFAYSKIFKMDMLRKLIPSYHLDRMLESVTETLKGTRPASLWFTKVRRVADELPSSTPLQSLFDPDNYTLAVMVLSFVKDISHTYTIITWYAHFRALLKSGDPVALMLVKGSDAFPQSIVYDSVIKRATEIDGRLRFALDVFDEMLQDSAAGAAAGPGDKTPRHPAPSIYTYNILLDAFARSRESANSEALLDLMRKNGIEPNIVTWNSLISGHAIRGNVVETVKTMQNMELAGCVPDRRTGSAFRFLHGVDRIAAYEMMDTMVGNVPPVAEAAPEAALEAAPEEAPDLQRQISGREMQPVLPKQKRGPRAHRWAKNQFSKLEEQLSTEDPSSDPFSQLSAAEAAAREAAKRLPSAGKKPAVDSFPLAPSRFPQATGDTPRQ